MGGLNYLWWNSPLVGFLAPVLLVVQLACMVHVLRTGRPYWWLWVIFGFPVVGIGAYVYLEVRPAWGKLDLDSLLWRLKSSQERIRILTERLDESSTVKNRLALAAELHEAGEFDRECSVLEEGLRGAFRDDATLLLRLAEAHLEAGRAAEAQAIAGQIPPQRSPELALAHALVQARALAALGQAESAEAALKQLVAQKKSEAPRYYYAEFLLAAKRRGEGVAILQDILKQYRRGTPVWRYQERRWYYAARRLLKRAA